MKDITDELPQVIADHVAARNRPDPQVFLATFASDAVLNDAQPSPDHDHTRARQVALERPVPFINEWPRRRALADGDKALTWSPTEYNP